MGFPAHRSDCLLSVLLLKGSKSFSKSNHCVNACTSAIEQLLLKWNGHDCDGSMHDAVGFAVVM